MPLRIPDFYDPANAARWAYRPDETRLFAEAAAWRKRHGIAPAHADRRRVHLLLIDVQKDFCFPEGALYVGGRSGRGAVEDSDRIARFIYANLGAITEVTCTADTHVPYQIFFPAFWVDERGEPPAAHREVTAADVRSGALRPNPDVAAWLAGGDEAWLRAQAEYYCAQLEAAGKYTLYLWPPHCLLGGDGHALVGVVEEARLFHAWARGARSAVEAKGSNPLTENYSALSPEVRTRHDGGPPIAERAEALMDSLLAADALIVAGQAASHCVKSTVEDLLTEIQGRDPALARKVYLLEDCMSSVAVADPAAPGRFLFDFTPHAEAALRRFAAAGMHVVRSTAPLEALLRDPA
jgi:nicotinamidase-related amidase